MRWSCAWEDRQYCGVGVLWGGEVVLCMGRQTVLWGGCLVGSVACQQGVLWGGILVVLGRVACQQGVLW